MEQGGNSRQKAKERKKTKKQKEEEEKRKVVKKKKKKETEGETDINKRGCVYACACACVCVCMCMCVWEVKGTPPPQGRRTKRAIVSEEHSDWTQESQSDWLARYGLQHWEHTLHLLLGVHTLACLHSAFTHALQSD